MGEVHKPGACQNDDPFQIAEDLTESLHHDARTVKRNDLPKSVREAARRHLEESVIPRAVNEADKLTSPDGK